MAADKPVAELIDRTLMTLDEQIERSSPPARQASTRAASLSPCSGDSACVDGTSICRALAPDVLFSLVGHVPDIVHAGDGAISAWFGQRVETIGTPP